VDHLLLLTKIMLLLGVANGTPVFARRLLKDRFGWPLDGGLSFLDGRPLLGASKTIRGVALSMLCTTLAAPLLGFDWRLGLTVGAFAMLGDLTSSFIKRRLNRPTSSQALGLDQIPESLFPLLACQDRFGLQLWDIVLLVMLFIALELWLSRLLYRLRIREHPY
jgi:CDP-2,3-bis-(O-geranylgeranyl)-sn-glycerol synthase